MRDWRKMKKNKTVLFLCTGNSCRSQMAEGILRHLAGDKFEVFSAGIMPTEVNPLTIEVMKEVGIDISKHRSKSIDEFRDKALDYIITVCDNARESCPYFAGGRMIHWDIEDPISAWGGIEASLVKFRRVRDRLWALIEEFSSQTQ